MIRLRPMRLDDVELLVGWDDDPEVAAGLGARGSEWYDWTVELARDVPWRELLIAEDDERPVGFMQIIDACEEESHYWGDVAPGTWALDIWIGSPHDRGRGVGMQMMRVAIARVFQHETATTVLIDPHVHNRGAIEFYRKVGFEPVGERHFEDDHCLVMRLDRPDPSI